MCTRNFIWKQMEMNTEITIALITLLGTNLISPMIAYRQGRKKNNAEATQLEYQALEQLREFHKKFYNDLSQRLDELNSTTQKDRKKKYSMRNIIDWLSGIACKDLTCPKRVDLSEEDVDKITQETSFVEPNLTVNGTKTKEESTRA